MPARSTLSRSSVRSESRECPTTFVQRSVCTNECLSKARLTRSVESEDIHGGLLTLSELAAAYKQSQDPTLENERLEVRHPLRAIHLNQSRSPSTSSSSQIFNLVTSLPPTKFARYRNELILEAACKLIAGSLSREALGLSGKNTPWMDIIRLGMNHREVDVQVAASEAMRSASELTPCDEDITKYVAFFVECPRRPVLTFCLVTRLS